jgi:hypothetical protein
MCLTVDLAALALGTDTILRIQKDMNSVNGVSPRRPSRPWDRFIARQGRNQILDFSPARRGIGFWIEEKEAISKS